jgi:hypothetical protein
MYWKHREMGVACSGTLDRYLREYDYEYLIRHVTSVLSRHLKLLFSRNAVWYASTQNFELFTIWCLLIKCQL